MRKVFLLALFVALLMTGLSIWDREWIRMGWHLSLAGLFWLSYRGKKVPAALYLIVFAGILIFGILAIAKLVNQL